MMNGNKLNSINRNTNPLPFGEKDKIEIISYWNSHPNYKGFYERMKKRLIFPKNFPEIYQCRISGNKIYIITYFEKDKKRECFIYNLEGQYLKRIFLPLILESFIDYGVFTIHDEKFYQVIENLDKDIWELNIHDLK